ncbi:MAG TPA: hypothetical protein VNM37_11490 [Candidatus Dormibacteraeota bacterium]|nr:hypothetical protein [Candidatus Dormibacteraeota bacterium]
MTNLDDAQKKEVSDWIAQGLKLADIQKRLQSQFGLNLTYMEVRLLVDDLKLIPKDPPPKLEKNLDATPLPGSGASDRSPTPLAPDASGPDRAPLGQGKVSISVDALARPGTMVSGSVTFSDGQQAIWYLDQFGRMGLGPKQAGYKPSAPDLQAFQQALERELSKLGY